jgi:hypothetical protein
MHIRRLIYFIVIFAAIPLGARAQTSTSICVPQFVDGTSGGLRWQTTLFIANQEMTQTQARLQFYRNDGQPLQMMVNERERLRRRIQAGADGQAGVALSAQTASSFRSMGLGPLQAGSTLIDAPARIQVHAAIQVRDAEGNLLEETGVVPHPQFRAAYIFIDQSDNAAVGIAVANPADQPVSATFEFIAEDGVTVLGALQVTLGPHAQIARFVREMFPDFPEGIGFVRVVTSAPVCGLALRLIGLDLSQVPLFVNQ